MSEQFKSIETTELVKIANAIRTKTGTTDKISLEDMPAKIAAIEGGTALPELENEGTASDLLSGKQLIDSEGNIVEGTIATKTASNLTANGATVTVPAGYYASQATKSIATATQATPSITVSSAGKITASATQTAGYVSAGTKSGTKQLTTQAAKTITPNTTTQTAVNSGVYTTGVIRVNPIPSNYIVPGGTKTITTNGTHDVKSYASAMVNVAGEDVTSETNAYTAKLATLETAITALETELQGKASGGSSGGGSEWINVASLPTTYAVAPDEPNSAIYYYEAPENCIGVVFICYAEFWDTASSIFIPKVNGKFLSDSMGTGSIIMEDADGTGTILKITNAYAYAYLLPILSSDLS